MLFIGPLPPSMFKKDKEKEIPPPDLDVPITELGTVVPVLFGTRLIDSPSLVWYGNVNIIKKKVDPKGKK